MSWRHGLREFLRELRRRRVWRVAAGYAITAWLLVSVADTVFPRLLMPDWSVAVIILVALGGFPVAVILAWYYDIVPDNAGGLRALRARHWLGLGLGSIVFVAVAAGSARYWTSVLRPAVLIDSLVVLPFDDRTGEEGQDYFVGGMHSTLINELAQVGALRVISRTSALRYAGGGKGGRSGRSRIGAT